jgi:hypothetical protein
MSEVYASYSTRDVRIKASKPALHKCLNDHECLIPSVEGERLTLISGRNIFHQLSHPKRAILDTGLHDYGYLWSTCEASSSIENVILWGRETPAGNLQGHFVIVAELRVWRDDTLRKDTQLGGWLSSRMSRN